MGDFQLSGRSSRVRQREIQQIVRGAIKAGARQVRVKLGDGAEVIIPLVPDDETPVAKDEQITL